MPNRCSTARPNEEEYMTTYLVRKRQQADLQKHDWCGVTTEGRCVSCMLRTLNPSNHKSYMDLGTYNVVRRRSIVLILK